MSASSRKASRASWWNGSRPAGRCSKLTGCSSSAPACSVSLLLFSASSLHVPRVNARSADSGRRTVRLRTAIVVSLVAVSVTARAATLFDPALRFRLLKTDHFRIYFHQREDRLARRLAVIAEETWVALQQPLRTQPPPLTHV